MSTLEISSGKRNVVLYLDQHLVQEAKDRGINLSRFLEYDLRLFLQRMNQSNSESASEIKGEVESAPAQNDPQRSNGAGWCGGWDSNPRRATTNRGESHSLSEFSALLNDFRRFLMVDRCKSKVTAKDYQRHIGYFLANVGKPVEQIGIEDVREYMLRLKETRSMAHYTNLLSGLKSFFRDFLKRPEVIDGFKFPAKEIAIKTIPSREDLARFYHVLPDIRIKALFLMLASTGLRLGEILSLKLENVDFTRRMVVPKCHMGETKRSWVSFFNEETEEILERFLKVRYKRSQKLFPIGEPDLKRSWDVARQATRLDLQRKDLRDWFADEMGRLGVQDRYIDAFQGRTPKSVLARHYSDYAPDKLQVIYEKACLKTLSDESLTHPQRREHLVSKQCET